MVADADSAVSRERIQELRRREDETFAARTKQSARLAARARAHMPGSVPMAWMNGLYRTPPLYVTHGEGARFFDMDGNVYLDFNVCDLSMTMGFGPAPIVEAVSRQVARGAHFLLATEDSIEVAEELARRNGLPYWQFTLSATGANTEVIRIARLLTGRGKIIVFRGHYHGHLDETLVKPTDGPGEAGSRPALLGLPAKSAQDTLVVPFNDPEALEAALKSQEVAVVITEPALTNCNVILPEPGYLAELRRLTLKYGTLLCYDEAHSYQFAYGGLVRAWSLNGDFHVLGKGLGSGVSFALYGMTSEIGRFAESHLDSDTGPGGLATGGTTYASALAVAAAKAALLQVLTEENYRRVERLGARLAAGLDELFARHGLPWKAFHLGPRAGYCLTPTLPRNFSEALVSLDYELIDTRRVFMANRGLWDAVASAGPQTSFTHSDADIDSYLSAADQFLAALAA